MKYISVFVFFLLMSANTFAGSDIMLPGEENTLSLYNHISTELLNNPSGENSYRYIVKLADLSRDTGRIKTAELFRRCAAKIASGEEKTDPAYFILNYYSEYLTADRKDKDPFYKGVDKWLISGPWQRYGKPDLYSIFPPEEKHVFNDFKAARSITPGGRIYPFGFISERRGVVYSSVSFSADIPLRVWIISNAEFRLFVNGVETINSGRAEEESLSGVSIKGAKGYTLLIKIADNGEGDDPFFRVILTDAGNQPLQFNITGSKYSGSFSAENFFSSCDLKSVPVLDEIVNMRTLRDAKGNNSDQLYIEAKALLAKYPDCSESYHTLIPLLDRTGRDTEFYETVSSYKKIFPDSEYYLKWETDFYKTRDSIRFSESIEKLPDLYSACSTAEYYINILSEKNDYASAVRFSEKFSEIPSLRKAVAGVVKKISSPGEWRNYLIEKMAATGDPLYFYYMGNADVETGLDPVLYWEKALNIRSDMRDVREAADIFENAGGEGSVYYSGRYTDFHPDFLWNGIKRKVTVRVFDNGNYVTECVDIIPSDIDDEKGVSLLPFKDIRILYSLRCHEGISEPVEIEQKNDSSGGNFIRFKNREKADFFILKYTGYSRYDQYPFYIMKNFELKDVSADISEIEFEVISENEIKPVVTFMDKEVKGRIEDKKNETVFNITENFNYKDGGRCSASVRLISSDIHFTRWYNELIKVLRSRNFDFSVPGSDSGNLQDKISAVRNYIQNNYQADEGVSYEPHFPGDILSNRHGTSEELAILALFLLEKSGVKGFISFIREHGETLSDKCEAAVFVPESKGKGYWIRFTDRNDFKKAEALIIKGDSFEIIPVSDK